MDSERFREMLEMYGELCNQETAAKILCTSTRTIRRMVTDGRLRAVDKHIDVRSIARYIDAPWKPKRNKVGKIDFYAASFRGRLAFHDVYAKLTPTIRCQKEVSQWARRTAPASIAAV